jgi:branched-chain amino acid transport system permease protein
VAVSFVTALVAVRLAGAYVIVLTLALQFCLENTVFLSERLTNGHLVMVDRPDLFGIDMRRDDHYYYLVLGTLLIVMAHLHRARRSRFGRPMIMAGADPVAAAVAGVSVWRYRVAAFVVAGSLAGVVGSLAGPLFFTPPGALPYLLINSLFYLAVPVLAGFDSIAGTVLIAVALTLIPQILLSWQLNVFLLGGLAMAVGRSSVPEGWAARSATCAGGGHES